jgi:hypothetical protein
MDRGAPRYCEGPKIHDNGSVVTRFVRDKAYIGFQTQHIYLARKNARFAEDGGSLIH